MSTDYINYEVEIQPALYDHLALYLTASNDMNFEPKGFFRRNLTLAPNDIKILRSGKSGPELVRKIARTITEWFWDQKMLECLENRLAGDKPVGRLVFRVHPNLLDTLADLPVELLRIQHDWLALRPAVAAIVHQLEYSGKPKNPATSLPLKVLVVRSSPEGLQIKVPPAAPICNQIIELAKKHLGQNAVQVDLLSREVTSLESEKTWEEFEAQHLPHLKVTEHDSSKKDKERQKWKEFRAHLLRRKINEIEPATWENFKECLKYKMYDILVYLGHGNLTRDVADRSKVGVLQFENANGTDVHGVTSGELKVELQHTAIPVVLLTSCLTAAEVDVLDSLVKGQLAEDIPQWALGSQGVAQALVNSGAGVQLAVGMRYQLETNAAVNFLRAFFESLLKDQPGNVEAAVRAGRRKLFSMGEYSTSWSAPVIFRTRSEESKSRAKPEQGEEPMFGFLASPPRTYTLEPIDAKDQEMREEAWKALIQTPSSPFPYRLLDNMEERIRDRALAQGALIMPERKETKPDEQICVLINFSGQLNIESVRCKLAVSGGGASIQSLRSTETLRDGGFTLADMTETGGSEISFIIKRSPGEGANPLPEGALLKAILQLGASNPAIYSVSPDILGTEPPRTVRPVNNVVLVLPA